MSARTAILAALTAIIVVASALPVSRPATTVIALSLQSPYALTLYPTQDAWVDQEAFGTNYGADPELNIGRDIGQQNLSDREALIRFDLSMLPQGATVLTATLRLYQVQATGATPYYIWPDAVGATWDEVRVTWNTKPIASNMGDGPVALDATSGWKDIDATHTAFAWTIGEIQNFGILLRGDGNALGQRVFDARETSKRSPYLVIEYSLPAQCSEILSPQDIPSPVLVNFDDVAADTTIGTHYQSSYGVTFENNDITRAKTFSDPAKAKSSPNVAGNEVISGTNSGVPMRIAFDSAKAYVGFWMGNGGAGGLTGSLTAYDSSGSPICTVSDAPVPDTHSEFIGVYDQYGRIARVDVNYGATTLAESIDDLYFAPAAGDSVQPTIFNILPSGWVTTTKTPSVYASVIDAGSGISVTSASYRYSTDGGTTWSTLQPASVSGGNGVTTTQTMTATNVAFNQDADAQNLIEFRIADLNGNVGTAQRGILIDTTPPTPPPLLTTSSHTVNVWSNDNSVDLSWSGASDATSGLSGYSVLFDHSPSTLPDRTEEAYANAYTSPILADGADWYAHVRTVDWAGNASATAADLGPLKIDTVPPANPVVISFSHLPSVWSTDPTVDVSWSGASDNASGVFGYRYIWDYSPNTVPDTSIVGFGISTTSPILASGNSNYFHLRTRDVAGNWSPAAVNSGPYFIDTVPPSSAASSPATSSNWSFTLSWSGSDADSGIASYDVQYRDLSAGGSWTNLLLSTSTTSSIFYGENGHIYQFRSRARDNVGNLEPYPSTYDSQTSVANIDLSVRDPGLEVNQAVQDLDNSVILIAGKRTFVRAYVQSNSDNIPAVPAQLRVWRGSTLMGTLTPSNPGAIITVRRYPNRSNLNDAYYFEVPTAWLSAGSVTFAFDVNSPPKYAESNYSNNSLVTTVNFVNSPAMNLVIFDVPYWYNGAVQSPRPVDRASLQSWLQRAFPISTLNVDWGFLDPPYPSVPEASTVNSTLVWAKILAIMENGEDRWTRYYGMAIDTGGFMRGKAVDIPSTVASGPTGIPVGYASWDTDESYGDWYGGHELGHTYGRRHVAGSPYAGEDSCGDEGGPDESYPYPYGNISPNQLSWSNNGKWGFDARGPTVIPPDWKDVMTYCAKEWLSDYTYEGIYSRMISEKPVSTAQIREMTEAGIEHLAVFGTIITPTDVITLHTFYRVPDAFDVLERDASGEYHIRFLDSSDTQLADYPFSPHFNPSSDQPVGLIAELVPWVTDTRRIAILHGDTFLTSRDVTPNSPTVTITSPNGGEILSGNSFIVTWTASDADGDALTYSLDYSRDGGATWHALSPQITGTQAILDLTQLPGTTQGRFRVWVSDGINTAVDISDGFAVESKLPTIVSIAPTSGHTFVVSQTIAFEGQAHDPEDGLLPDNGLEWSSDLMGPLGTGQLLHTMDLISGTHTITLEATDSDGNVARASTTIVVAEQTTTTETTYRIFLPIVLRAP